MVNKQVEWVKEELGTTIAPYNSKTPLTSDESQELFENFCYDTGLENFDTLILHGAPSSDEDEIRYDTLEKAAFYLQASGKNPKIFLPEDFKEHVKRSEVIHEESVNYIHPTITEDELTEPYSNFNGTGRIHVTSDYHAEGVDHLSSLFDKDDFVVLSADTSEEEFNSENYTEILGPAAKLANNTPVNWENWAEGKEIGRKLTDRIREPRF